MKGRLALVTGGVGDLGTAICRHLYHQGAKIIAADKIASDIANQWQQEQKNQGYDFQVMPVDITEFDSCASMITELVKKHGPLAILVNNAGINRDAQLYKMTPEQWLAVINTDLNGLFNVTRNVIEHMIQEKYGRIISISSVNGLKGQFGQTNYAAAKAGIIGFTKSLALETARFGITVNAIAPGYIESRMVAAIPEKVKQIIIDEIPMKRLAKPEEIAAAVAFLASESSGYITGAHLDVTGGLYMS